MTSRPYSWLAKPGNIYVRSVLSLPPITAMRFHRDEGVRGSPRFTCEAHEKDDAGGHATTGRARRSPRRRSVRRSPYRLENGMRSSERSAAAIRPTPTSVAERPPNDRPSFDHLCGLEFGNIRGIGARRYTL